MTQTVIMDESSMTRTLTRLAHEIIETNPEEDILHIVGIKRRGICMAKRLAENIEKFSDMKVICSELDVTHYRDDLDGTSLSPLTPAIDEDVTGKTVILADDVLYTGRTVRAAIDAIIKSGRPSKIKLCVLVDRGHRELPIRGDYVGKNVPTSHKEKVRVRFPEYDGVTEAVIIKEE